MADEEPEIMKREMEETRAALADKIHTLEEKVSHTVEETAQAVKGTVNAVEETFASVKDVFDIPAHVQRHPWLMMGCAVATGYVIGHMLESPRPQPTSAAAMGPTPQGSPPPPSGAAEPRRPGLLDFLGKEVGVLEEMAVGALMGVLRDTVTPALSEGLRSQARSLIDGLTSQMGGKPVPTGPADSCERPDSQREKEEQDAKREIAEMGGPVGSAQGQGSPAVGPVH